MSKVKKTIIAGIAWLIQVIEALITTPEWKDAIADTRLDEAEVVRLIATLILGVYGVYKLKNTTPPGETHNPNESVAAA